jgi:zinc/manganese transport system ATP-binding protein
MTGAISAAARADTVEADAAPARPPVVRLRAAAAARGGRTVWSEVTVEVGAGEFVAVLGPNGSGKSTLLGAILGAVPLTAGRVEVLGAPAGRRRARIGYLPQRRAFDAALRLRGVDIVRLGLDGARWGVPVPALSRLLAPAAARARDERVREVLELVGASHYAHRPIGECSGGEQQRLLIAQALIRRPELVLLDEPLDSLDVPSQAGISALLRDICRREGVSVVMVAHDVNPILDHLDRLVFLARGRAMSGPPAEVITADRLTALYGIPIDVLRDRTGRLVVVGRPEAADPTLGLPG